nr:MAG TPA: hypothetical protein [Caudoviricetes sp.]
MRNRNSFPFSRTPVTNLKNRTIQSEKLRGLYKTDEWKSKIFTN